ncbi:MAG: TonB-dependent receptor [Tannerellaceae bacterium]|jgi:TonB-linked SusC/RagA family outer membrane protein|nr:TonB-dependent receptor [Tannerellaceae bacterium]
MKNSIIKEFNHLKTTNVFRIMKLSAFFLFLCVAQLYAAGAYSQTTVVRIQKNTLTLQELITEVESQTGFLFIFSKEDIDVSREMKIKTKSRQISDILKDVFENSNITYKFVEQYITLRKMQEAEVNLLASFAQSPKITITGVVKDTNGEPVIGANISEKGGGSNGTISNVDGQFTLEVSPGATLVVSYIGYNTLEIAVGNQTSLNITLDESNLALDEVVVVGYGVQKKVNLTGAVSVVRSDEIMQRKVGQTSAVLQGLAPGVSVTQRSGQPGRDGGAISIRGKTTLGNNDALILVDGVEMDLNNIDPTLIESISVLKDAASSSIYGSRAANGVILVTTKRGSIDTFSATYSGSVGWQKPTDLPKMVNVFDFMEMTDIAYQNMGTSPIFGPERIAEWRANYLTDPDHYPNTDWQKLVLKDSGFENTHFLTVSGGSKRVKALLSIGRVDQKGYLYNTGYERNSLRLNTDIQIIDQLTAKADIHIKQSKIGEPSWTSYADNGPGSIIHWMTRSYPTEVGILQNGEWGEGHNGWNPIAKSKDGGTKTEDAPSITANLSLIFKPVEWLFVDFGYAPNYWWSNTSTFVKALQTYKQDGSPGYLDPGVSSLREESRRDHRNQLHLTANFNKTFNSHTISALAGFQQEEYRMTRFDGYREDFVFPNYPVLDAGGAEVQKANGTAEEWAIRSFFGRVNYNFMSKYLFEANLRTDGSSRFAEGKRWGYFPSFSVGWRLSEENFWEPLRSTVDELKITGSWGQLGNQNIGTYPSISTINLSATKYIFNDKVMNGATITNMANKEISWETTESWNIGLTTRLWNKLSISGDYYYKKTRDILLTLDIPRIIGLSAPYQNAGVVENKGWDLEIRYTDNDQPLKYSIAFNLSDVRNKVLDLRGVEDNGLQVNREGYAMYSLLGYDCLGYITEADFDASGKYTGPVQNSGNVAPGDLKYKDQNGDNEITPSDQVIMGNVIPRFSFGFNAFLEYKGFDFNLLLQGVGKADGYITGQGILPFWEGSGAQEQHKDYWTPENRNAKFPRLTFNGTNNTQNSSFWMKNAAYLRLKNIQLGYTLPARMTQVAFVKKLRFYVSGQNLFTLDDFWDGYDVEAPVGLGGFYPQTRVFTCGLDITF